MCIISIRELALMVREFARETWVKSQVELYQRIKKWYFVSPGLTLSFIRYGSRVKWVNPGKGVVPSPWCSSYRKRNPSGHPPLKSPTLLYFFSIREKYVKP